jgi:hypothetical protein
MNSSKGFKEVHKTKPHKGSDVQFGESFKVPHATADAQFQLRVFDHSTFGSDGKLGQAAFFVADTADAADQDKTVNVGEGTVVIRSSFASSESSLRPSTSHSTAGEVDGADSPASKRRSFLSKRSPSGTHA